MSYQLTRTNILYQTSKYAPVGVVALELFVSPVQRRTEALSEMNLSVEKISVGGLGGSLVISGGESLPEIYSQLVLDLQRYAGHSVTYYRVEADGGDDSFCVFIEYADSATALYAAELSQELLNVLFSAEGALDGKSASALSKELDDYLLFALARRPDRNSGLLIAAATRLDVPVLRYDATWWGDPTWPGAAELTGVVQFGWGVNRRRSQGPLPLDCPEIERLQSVRDRAQLIPRLREAGLPLARQDLEFVNRNQVSRSQRSARRIGYPVTLMPKVLRLFQYQFPDDGVFGPVEDEDQLALVTRFLRDEASVDVWVESYVPGGLYRFLILGRQVASVVRCDPPAVTGDGERSIRELLRRAAIAASGIEFRVWASLAADDKALSCRLRLQGLSLADVPPAGSSVVLRGLGTYYNGGVREDVTRQIPARFAAIALNAAEAAGIGHLAGVDLRINAFSGVADVPNCAVVGVDPTPDLMIHSFSVEGGRQNIGDDYLRNLFPDGAPSRIPTAAVTGTNGKTTTCRMVAGILREAGFKTGLSCSDGAYLDSEQILNGDVAGVSGAITVLSDPRAEAAVLETARGGLARNGIAFDRCNVGACLNVAGDHLGEEGIETLDDMATHKRQVVELASDAAVLNAEDPRCLAMREHVVAREIILVARSANHPEVRAHCLKGGRAIVLDDGGARGNICRMDRNGLSPLTTVESVPATFNGLALFNIENAMAAAAIACGLGVDDESIVRGLQRFTMTVSNAPGRMNVYTGLPFQLIADYAHNPHGLQAFCSFTRQLNVEGRRIAVLVQGRDRNDEELIRNAAIVATEFDYFICREPLQPRGRNIGRIAELYHAGLLRHGVGEERIEVITDPEAAIDRSLSIARPGDLLVIFMGDDFRDKLERFAAAGSRAVINEQ